ncbi:MAG: hypothetical protein PHU25_20840, partial [Deltaproteobacteria bacterium]|nr:hypothetical protein [Deltaproteobacteria bacterium]
VAMAAPMPTAAITIAITSAASPSLRFVFIGAPSSRRGRVYIMPEVFRKAFATRRSARPRALSESAVPSAKVSRPIGGSLAMTEPSRIGSPPSWIAENARTVAAVGAIVAIVGAVTTVEGVSNVRGMRSIRESGAIVEGTVVTMFTDNDVGTGGYFLAIEYAAGGRSFRVTRSVTEGFYDSVYLHARVRLLVSREDPGYARLPDGEAVSDRTTVVEPWISGAFALAGTIVFLYALALAKLHGV